MVTRYRSNPYVIGVDLRNEPRAPATWGGSATTDWHAAAERGGNAVLAVNSSLLVFVEGVNYAGDLSGVATLPVQLNVSNQLVYEAHDYGFWYSSGFTSYSNYVSTITPKWGYLVTGANPQPLWVGEFGTCNNANTCVTSTNATDGGYWFQAMTTFVEQYSIDTSYWAINGTTESGNAGGFNSIEGYGVLNISWNGSALNLLTSRLQSMMTTGPSLNLVANSGGLNIAAPGAPGAAIVAIVPAGGFSGTVSLACSVTGPAGAIDIPQCSVPSSEAVSGNAVVNATVSITTTAASAEHYPALRGGSLAAIAGVFLLLGSGRRRRRSFLLALALVASSFAVTACNGSSTSSNSGNGGSTSGTTTGPYTVVVTATASGTNPATAQIPVTVQ